MRLSAMVDLVLDEMQQQAIQPLALQPSPCEIRMPKRASKRGHS